MARQAQRAAGTITERRPRTPLATARAAAEAIAQRRTDVDDPDLGQMPDLADLLGVARYAVTFRRVPDEVARVDAVDAVRILDYVDGERDRLMLRALRAGKAAGATNREVGAPLGLRDRRAVVDLIGRLEAAAAGRVKDSRVLRALRRAQAAEQARVDAHAALLLDVVDELARLRDRLPVDLVEDVDDVAALVDGLDRAGPVRAGVAADVRLLLRELRDQAAGDELVRALLVRAAPLLRDRAATG